MEEHLSELPSHGGGLYRTVEHALLLLRCVGIR